MKKNLLGETVLEPWAQEVSDRICEEIKESLEKQIKELFKSHNFKV